MITLAVSAIEKNRAAEVSMLVNTCVGCHGNDGSSVGPATPSIAGMRKPLFIKAMQDMKSGKRPSTVMGLLAKGYTDEEVEMMADFFSKQDVVRYTQNFEHEKAERGKELHNQYCDGCHKIEGRDQPLFNALSGQWMPYLKFRLSDFRNGDASSSMMASALEYFIMNNESEESLEDLLHFYGSQE
ncbi:hypothetical protein PN36_14130 [Candidatus Thiomargarita nelsonii]|uniref:Cytochrome c domain-containing protein n=1 Tax=Candidatus Thiomargarita nelsonii TaxID=1003181 RepID=A0A0A6RYQ9_9GAMM|nr:hypothetical protein PN36_14130 [Candidatus Thiomargarita nelsonii]